MSTFDPEDWIPRTQSAFRVDQIATQIFAATIEHIYSLIKEGEIVVPKERIESAPSHACILVPRESLVDFCRRRRWSPPPAKSKGDNKRCRQTRKKGRR